jgi:glutamyl-tRNA synthetase
MSREDLIASFSLEGINRSNAVVNFTEEDPIDPKALWLNSQHLRTMPLEELVPLVRQRLERDGLGVPGDEEWFRRTVDVIRARCFTLDDFATRGRAYFADDFSIEAGALNKLNHDGARGLLGELASRLEADNQFTEQSVEANVRQLAADKGVKAGVIINAARAALSGQAVGPSAFTLFAVVGRDRSIKRLKQAAGQSE